MSFAYTNITTPYRVAGSFRIGSIQTLYVNINTRVGFLANITEFNVLKALLLHKQPYERELFRKGHVEVLHKQVYIELGNVFAVIIRALILKAGQVKDGTFVVRTLLSNNFQF